MGLLDNFSRWSLYFIVAGLVIVIASIWYTASLANQLSAIEKQNIDLYREVLERIESIPIEVVTLEDDLNGAPAVDDYSIETRVMENAESLPQIQVDMRGKVVAARGFGRRDSDTSYLKSVVENWIADGARPIPIGGQFQYIGESWALQRLRYYPYIQLFLITSFVFLGYFGINQTRKAEQNRVWVGLAKETAHQLGTPISAILGWVEHLKMMYADDPEILEISGELAHDVDRLSMVANRFSKIGATPELEPHNIFVELHKCREYMQKRAPRRVTFDFPEADGGDIKVAINPLLFDWVFENLLRNALDAMDGKGQITGRIRELENKVFIDITDTGKGISPKNIRRVFNPGFTTKKRGWGLGLSLVKRIVQEYHKGKIWVSHSEIGRGTTFTIMLPRGKE